MRVLRFLVLMTVLGVTALPAAAAERLYAFVSLSRQTIDVYKDGRHVATWPVSTGVSGHRTPKGAHTVQFLSKNHRSSIYNNAPMPHAVFFNGNIAVHGTFEEKKLGRPASHGCVRLARENARTFFGWVADTGISRSVIEVGA